MSNWKERIREKQKKDNRAVHNFLPDPPLSKNVEEKDELKINVQENEEEKLKSNLNVDKNDQEQEEVQEAKQENVEEPLNSELKLESKDKLQSDLKENLNVGEQVIHEGQSEVSATVQERDHLIYNLNFTITQRNHQPSFEDQYKRKTFAIDRDLLKRFNKHMARFPKGEQTRVINELLRQYVDWLDLRRRD